MPSYKKGNDQEARMKGRLVIVCLTATALLGLVVCSPAAPKTLSVDILPVRAEKLLWLLVVL